jgi:hypothetical protein
MNSTTQTAAMVAKEWNKSNENSDTKMEDIQYTKARLGTSLTLSARHPFQNFSTPCILNVNNTGAKQRRIMK